METKTLFESSAEFNHLVLPQDTNALGTIFGGRIMEWIDIAASIVAMRHCRRVAVTASMDALDFIEPVKLGDIVILRASVNYVRDGRPFPRPSWRPGISNQWLVGQIRPQVRPP